MPADTVQNQRVSGFRLRRLIYCQVVSAGLLVFRAPSNPLYDDELRIGQAVRYRRRVKRLPNVVLPFAPGHYQVEHL